MELTQHPDAVILDYGCGRGDIIEEGRKHGICLYGVEIFYDQGTTTKAEVQKKNLLGTSIKEIHDGKIPFSDSYFDGVISNQVFEHVTHLDCVLQEIHRVLKPGGFLVSIFPAKDVIREGHCGIPCLHWFSTASRLRFYYALALRRLGFGYHKGDKSSEQWTRDFIAWLDEFTCYRERTVLFQEFQKYFTLSCLEPDYIAFRLNATSKLRYFKTCVGLSFFQPIIREICRRLGGLVILAQKDHSQRTYHEI